ncbi:TPA: hypothetical protein JG825_001212 [Vibrio parahaemolyticus]|uniref:hypothetical protein n=1 Tax=Vibrio parahaemolyticus TaxID=670 RepID=UPI00205EBA73|nr:hypothetical protein [Vibrio parahaemolyticus]UPR18594.1 hypothetical protein H9J99_19425 [Vibrio parahaemolyticus]UPR22958.1 hypothetical protein H9J98_16445 [Vibrio parahaemolyticus]HAV1517938.1 hypothetical protein [Vibrio parahaemolyticus]HAV1536904.1 hypothetical protein [Vibrio parahaemolyticus]
MKRIMMLMCLMLGTSQAFAADVEYEQKNWRKLADVYYYAIPYKNGNYVLNCVVGYPNEIGGFELSLGVRKSHVLNYNDLMSCQRALACNEDNKSTKCRR